MNNGVSLLFINLFLISTLNKKYSIFRIRFLIDVRIVLDVLELFKDTIS